MRFFSVLDAQYLALLVFLGLIFFVLVYIAFGGYVLPTRKGRREEIEEYPEGLRAANGPLPLLLFFIYLSFIIWAVGYIIVIGIKGEAF
jgi:hypothetical protein